MITFKQFLEEARMASLYHATPIDNLDNILSRGFAANTMQTFYRGNKSASQGQYGVSFARNMKSSDWYMKEEHGRRSGYVVFEVDQLGINSRHKLKPVDYFGTNDVIYKRTHGSPYRRKETEEFAIVKRKWNENILDYEGSVSPRYIKAVYYFKTDLDGGDLYSDHIKDAMVKYPQIRFIAR